MNRLRLHGRSPDGPRGFHGPSGRPTPDREVVAIGSSAILVARRAVRDLPVLAGILVLVWVTGSIALAVPREIGAIVDSAAREAVTDAGSQADLLLQTSVADASGFDTTTAERLVSYAAELPGRLPPTLASVTAQVGTGIIGPALDGAGPVGDVELKVGVLDPAARSGVRLIAGELPDAAGQDGPSDAARPVDVLVSQGAAAAAGLSVGSTISAPEAGSDEPITVRITGIGEPVDATADTWQDLPGLWSPTSPPGGTAAPAVVALTGVPAFDEVAPRFPAASAAVIRVSFDAARFDLARFTAVRDSIDALETSTAGITEGAAPVLSAASGYEKALDGFPEEASAATAQLSALAAGLLGAAVLVSVIAVSALARRRRAEVALLRSLGASLPLLAVHAAVESVVVVVLGAAAAVTTVVALGWEIVDPRLLVAAASIIVIAPVVATLRPLVRPPRPGRVAILRVTGVTALVAITVTALIALRTAPTAGGGTIDPLALLAPVLCAAVLALAVAPLPVALVGLLSRGVARTRGAPGLLAASSAREGRSLLTLVAVIVATGAAVTSTLLLQTVQAEQERDAWNAVGADVRVENAADPSSLIATFEAGGAAAAAVGVLDGIDAQGASSSIPIALLAVDEKYGDVLAALPAESPQHASAGAVRELLAPAGDPLPVRLPVLVDSRLAGVVGLGDFSLDLGSVSVPATVSATLPARPGYLDGPIAVIDRERFRQVLDALSDGDGAGGDSGVDSGVDDDAVADALDSLARPSSVLAVGLDVERTLDRIPGQALSGDAAGNASESVTVLRRSQVLADEQQGAFASGIATATLQTVLAAGTMALLGLIVTTVLGARRRGRTLALLGALGVPARAGLALAAGELAPLVAGGVVGGVIAAGVVLITAAPALGIADPATVAVPAWLAPAALLAAVAALALALVVDTPLSRRVRSADILRTGEES